MAIWLFFMMAIPSVSSIAKMVTLLIFIGVRVLSGKIIYRKKWLNALIIWLAFFLLSILIGCINGYEFSFDLFEIYVIRPIVFFLVCSVIKEETDVAFLFNLLLFITGFISVYDLLYFAEQLGILPSLISYFEKGDSSITIVSSSFLAIRVSNTTAMFFLVPMVFTLFFFRAKFNGKVRKKICVLMVLCLINVMFSGRRAFMVTALIMLVLNFMYYVLKSSGWRTLGNRLLQIIIVFLVLLVLEQILEKILNYRILRALFLTVQDALEKTSGNTLRAYQKMYMLKYFKKSPIFGNGLQAYMDEYIKWRIHRRNYGQTNKWSYEYFYFALAFQIGIVGCGLVVAYFIAICRRIYKNAMLNFDSEYGIFYLATISGALGFIIVGYSNPLVTSSWFWFIMIAMYMFSDRKLRDYN
jgi:hypothetical protein